MITATFENHPPPSTYSIYQLCSLPFCDCFSRFYRNYIFWIIILCNLFITHITFQCVVVFFTFYSAFQLAEVFNVKIVKFIAVVFYELWFLCLFLEKSLLSQSHILLFSSKYFKFGYTLLDHKPFGIYCSTHVRLRVESI